MASERTTGVLLTAVGGPNSLDEVGPFLLDIRGGRPTPPALVEEFKERYRRIGGRSPLLGISLEQAKALEARLNRDGGRFRTYVGMRNWRPYIRETVAEMAKDGLGRVVVLPLTPYHSRRSVGAYFAAVKEAAPTLGHSVDVTYIDSWNTEPALIEAFVGKIREALPRLAAAGAEDPVVVFTAHSLPRKLMEEGDDYEEELQETMRLVLESLPRLRARVAYQSAGRTEEPWLGPPLDRALADLAKAGEKAVLVVPFGFISDHLEILYDLDVEAKETAEKLGMRLERTESLNTDPRFIDAMAEAVGRALDPSSI